jgi:hypothetical protein
MMMTVHNQERFRDRTEKVYEGIVSPAEVTIERVSLEEEEDSGL